MKFNKDKKLLITLDLSSLSLEELNEIKNIIDSEMKSRVISIPATLADEGIRYYDWNSGTYIHYNNNNGTAPNPHYNYVSPTKFTNDLNNAK